MRMQGRRLVHRVIQAPLVATIIRQVPTESLKQTRDVMPTHAQPLQNSFCAPNISPQHQVQWYLRRMPGHDDPRLEILWQLNATAITVILDFQRQVTENL